MMKADRILLTPNEPPSPSRRDFVVSSLTLAASFVTLPFAWGEDPALPGSEFALFHRRLNDYTSQLKLFLLAHPLETTNWRDKKLWDGGDDGLLAGALDYDLIGRVVRSYHTTKDDRYLQQAIEIATFLKATYLAPTNCQLPGYRTYVTEGYFELGQTLASTMPDRSKEFFETVRKISTNAGYGELNERTEKAILHPSLSREVALSALAKMYAIKTQDTRDASALNAVTPYVRAMKHHFTLFSRSLLSSDKSTTVWGPEMTALANDPENYLIKDEFVRPFMVAISARAAAILTPFLLDRELLSHAADALIALKLLYIHGKGLPYTDRALPAESQARQLSIDTPDDSVNPSLNLLIANSCERVAVALESGSDSRDSRKSATIRTLATQLRADTSFVDGTLKEVKQALY